MTFVTGGTGLLGSHLLVELTQKHESITAIYRNPNKIQDVRTCFDYYLQKDSNLYFQRIKWVDCDILDVVALEDAMKGHSIVYHCAGFVSFAKQDFSKLMEINQQGTANMVNISLALGIEKFCFVSSTAAVGRKDIPEGEAITEEGKWVTTPETNGYSISKYSAEKEVWRGAHEGLNIVIVNPCVIFGAWSWEDGSMRIFRSIEKGMLFYPPGGNAFVDARDVVNIMIQLMENNIFNERFLCVGENATFRQLFYIIAQLLEKKQPRYRVSKFLMGITWRIAVFWSAITFRKPLINKATARNAFSTSIFSNKKVKEVLNYEFYTLEETVRNATEYHKIFKKR